MSELDYSDEQLAAQVALHFNANQRACLVFLARECAKHVIKEHQASCPTGAKQHDLETKLKVLRGVGHGAWALAVVLAGLLVTIWAK